MNSLQCDSPFSLSQAYTYAVLSSEPSSHPLGLRVCCASLQVYNCGVRISFIRVTRAYQFCRYRWMPSVMFNILNSRRIPLLPNRLYPASDLKPLTSSVCKHEFCLSSQRPTYSTKLVGPEIYTILTTCPRAHYQLEFFAECNFNTLSLIHVKDILHEI